MQLRSFISLSNFTLELDGLYRDVTLSTAIIEAK